MHGWGVRWGRRRRQATAGLASGRQRAHTPRAVGVLDRRTPWGRAAGSWFLSTWRTCALCGAAVMCRVDPRQGVVAWLCSGCDL